MMGTMMQDLAFAIPGVDEAMSFAEIMKCVRRRVSSPHHPSLRKRGGEGAFVVIDCAGATGGS